MVKVIDTSLEQFCKRIQDKKLFVFGAGRRIKHVIPDFHVIGNTLAIVDNNVKLHNTKLIIGEHSYPIIDLKTFVRYCNEIGVNNVILLITPAFFSLQIIEQLDTYSELDGLNCYVSLMIQDHYTPQNFEFTNGEQKIPSKIHYCWFGKTRIPIHLQKYIDRWKEKCPDFEIVRWDESNYDVTKHPYMYEAYKAKKWGFVPDYARLDIIYNEGGIYLDTDVELLKNPCQLLNDEVFMGFSHLTMVALGLGFGAIKRHPLIKSLRDYYDAFRFITADGAMNLKTCNFYTHPVLLQGGFILNNTHQKKNGVVLYPSEVLCPMGYSLVQKNYTEKTIAIHHPQMSWSSPEERKGYYNSYAPLYERVVEG